MNSINYDILRKIMNNNSYSYIKSIAEELRGLAIEYNVPIILATQDNKQDNFTNSNNKSSLKLTLLKNNEPRCNNDSIKPHS